MSFKWSLGIAVFSSVLILAVIFIFYKRDAFSQSNFPCMEDEVLMFIPSETDDRTGCVHMDTLEMGFFSSLLPELQSVADQMFRIRVCEGDTYINTGNTFAVPDSVVGEGVYAREYLCQRVVAP